MMQFEFENLITTKPPLNKEYEVIEKVYTYHPLISECATEGKKQVAALYDLMGYKIFVEMLPKAEKARELDEQIREKRIQLEKLKEQLEEL